MIFKDKDRWVLKEGKTLRFFKTEEEAAKAAGLGEQWEFDHGIEKAEDVQETNDNEEKAHYSWLKKDKSETKES